MEELIHQRWLKYKGFDLEHCVSCKKSCWECQEWQFLYCTVTPKSHLLKLVKTLESSEELKK